MPNRCVTGTRSSVCRPTPRHNLRQRLSARDFDRQVAETQIRAVILNDLLRLVYPKPLP